MKEAPPPFNPKQQPPHLPPHFQEQVFNEERDQKSLLYQPQQKNGNVPPAIPVVYVEQNRSSYDGNLPSAAPVSSSTETNSGSRLPSANGGAGMFKGRYSDHPNCDICGLAFDVTKRRHQCRACSRYICGNCSPLMLLIPEGNQIDGARGYDPSIPQRACLHCAPSLNPLQTDLVTRYAKAHAEMVPHEAKSRLHVPFSPSLEKECTNAADIIGNFFRNDSGASGDRSIPISMLEKAHGLAIMTIVKAGFFVVGMVGTGIVLSRLSDGSWSAPSAIGTVGLGGGFEFGGEIVEVMIILGSPAAVQVFYSPQVNLGAGLDIAVGMYGRSAAAAAAISSTGLNGNYSYSLSKGLYAGISLQGSVISARNDLNRKFYGQDLEPSELLCGTVGQPVAAKPLYDALDRAMRGVVEHKQVLAERSRMMGPCRACNCQIFETHIHQVWNKKCKTCDHVH
uniref:FYVE-type domain-containing protein n=1 Tax=Hyaloperonospora arabidopsidis (strain Emoy2) TaxID=559515 RepID=M4BQX7_HYAAE